MNSLTTWTCLAWEGDTNLPNNNYVTLSNHIHHAEIKLLKQLQLKGI